jgi:hypothetical protein
LAGQAGPDPFLAAVTAALREIIHCSNTYAALFAEAEDLEHIHFHVLPRTDHPDTSFRGPFAFAPLGGDTAQVPGQARDQITSKLGAAASQRALPARPGEPGRSTSGAAQSTPRRSLYSDIRDGVKSSTASQEAVDTADQPILLRTLATTAGICRGH